MACPCPCHDVMADSGGLIPCPRCHPLVAGAVSIESERVENIFGAAKKCGIPRRHDPLPPDFADRDRRVTERG